MLVFAWFRRLRVGDVPAAAAAILFAAHPVQVTSVAWLAGRNDLLLGCFTLGALLLLTKDLQQPSVLSKAGHLVGFLGALFCKETAVCLPIIFAVVVFTQVSRRKLLGYWWLALSWIAAELACFAVRSTFVMMRPGYASKLLHTAWENRSVMLADIGKLLLPVRLQVVATRTDILVWPGLVGAGMVVLLCAVPKIRCKILFLAGTLLTLPTLMALLAADILILENRLYLAVVGVALLVAELTRRLLAQRPQWATRVYATLCGVCLLMTLVTLRYTGVYRDHDSFSRAAIAASPSSYIAQWLEGKKPPPARTGEEMIGFGSIIMPKSQFLSMGRRIYQPQGASR